MDNKKYQSSPPVQAHQPPPYNAPVAYPPPQNPYPTAYPPAAAPIMVNTNQQMQAPSQAPNMTVVQAPVTSSSHQGLAICSLVFAIVTLVCNVTSCCCTVPAIIMSAMALGSTRDDDKAKSYSSISLGLTAVSYIFLVIYIILYVVLVANAYSATVEVYNQEVINQEVNNFGSSTF